MARFAVAFIVVAALCAALIAYASVTAPHKDPRLAKIKGYRSWKRATSAPVDMSPSLAVSCIGPKPWDTRGNPHVAKVFLVYVNSVGAKAMVKEGKTEFPDGTVIVKEKYSRPNVFTGKDFNLEPIDYEKTLKQKPELLTVMVKKHGKWDYFAIGSDGKPQDGDYTPCRTCHETNKDNDYAFRTYVAKAAPPSGAWR